MKKWEKATLDLFDIMSDVRMRETLWPTDKEKIIEPMNFEFDKRIDILEEEEELSETLAMKRLIGNIIDSFQKEAWDLYKRIPQKEY